jgi:hypothetical protein
MPSIAPSIEIQVPEGETRGPRDSSAVKGAAGAANYRAASRRQLGHMCTQAGAGATASDLHIGAEVLESDHPNLRLVAGL